MLQQLLAALEDPDPEVFLTTLHIFKEMGRDDSGHGGMFSTKSKDVGHVLETIFAYLKAQLHARTSAGAGENTHLHDGHDDTRSAGSRHETPQPSGSSLLASIVECLMMLPLAGLSSADQSADYDAKSSSRTLQDLLDTLAELIFQPGLSEEARLSLYTFLSDPSRDVSDLPWGKTPELRQKAICVVLLGLADSSSTCVQTATNGALHLIGEGEDLQWLRSILMRPDTVYQLTSTDTEQRTNAYNVICRALGQSPSIKTCMASCTEKAVTAIVATTSSPGLETSFIGLLARQCFTEPSSQTLALALLLGPHGMCSLNRDAQEAACVTLMHCCVDLGLAIDFAVVGKIVAFARGHIFAVSTMSNTSSGQNSDKHSDSDQDVRPHAVVAALMLFQHIIPRHIRGLNYWFVGESGLLRHTLSLMTRSQSIDVRLAALRVIKEVLLAVPSTLARSKALHQMRSLLRECFAHPKPHAPACGRRGVPVCILPQ